MLLDLLYQMLRETHGLQRRCYTLTTNGGRCLEQLTSAVINLVASLAKQVRERRGCGSHSLSVINVCV